MVKNTKFWLAVGVEAVLLILIFVIIFFKSELFSMAFIPWLAAFIGVPVQYGVFNVVASGQTASAAATTVTPPQT